jgi:O-acetyl-ADP-ribose deacetylase (regulator of RNase III)
MDSYLNLNVGSLRKEFPELDEDVVRDVYHAAEKDCERARDTLCELSGRKRARPEDEVPIEAASGFRLTEQTGDLFSCSESASLAHCVSECLAMGKGIAVHFKKRFGRVAELKAQKGVIGGGAILPRPKQGSAFVYYLVTKARYFHKPTLAAVRQSCEWMRAHAVAHGVRCIALPRIGCGLDGLQWPDVKAVLVEVFGETDIHIAVYSL